MSNRRPNDEELSPSEQRGSLEIEKQREVWHFWRGSPELLAQVARVALRATGREGKATPGLIDVEAAGDHEIFASPTDFCTQASREALSGFTSIRINVAGDAVRVTVHWRWRRPWWSPFGSGKDAEVVLEVVGADKRLVDDAFTAVRTSLRRAAARSETRQGIFVLAIMVALTALVIVAVASSLYLLKVSREVIFLACVMMGALGLFVSAFVASWVYPSLEIAPGGRTRLRRTGLFVVPISLTLILSGVAKALYG